MDLTEEQKKSVASWVADGANVAEVQSRLAAEFQLNMTYMDVRFLIDDLELSLKDAVTQEADADAAVKAGPAAGGEGAIPFPGGDDAVAGDDAGGGVRVTVDPVQRPGALINGTVVFSDGTSAQWQLDQTGRLGLIPSVEGYKPSQADLQEFQLALQKELQQQGF